MAVPLASLVILAPHPDDDVLGCGLRIAAARARGFRVAVLFLTDGQASHPGSRRWPPRRLGMLRRAEARRALGRLGAGGVTVRFLGWPDGDLGAAATLRQRALRLRAVLRAVAGRGAHALLVTSPADHHPDHTAAFALARRAASGTAATLETYRVWSRVNREDGRRARDRAFARKRWAALAHRSQVRGLSDAPDGFTFDAHALAQLLREEEAFAVAERRGLLHPLQARPAASGQ